MVDKNFSMSSFLALRYIEKTDVDFCDRVPYRHCSLVDHPDKIYVNSAEEIGKAIEKQLSEIKDKNRKIGLLLSGGMDSAILSSYLAGCEAYTFRFMDGSFQREELKRAEAFAEYSKMRLHYVDIDWKTVIDSIDQVMFSKGGPVHSIETQVFYASKQALKDEVDIMIIGDGSDYIFGGMDQLLSREWSYEDFYHRYIYVEPEEVLKEPVSVRYLFDRYRNGEKIDYLGFLNVISTEESFGSYSNAFSAAGMNYYDPYERLCLSEPLDLNRIRSGESKYLIRELFRMRFPGVTVPEKVPMPRPVDFYFKDWKGPTRPEFRENIDMSRYTGNQKWLMWCLERFLNIYY